MMVFHYNDDTSHYVIMIFYYGLVVHVLYFVIVTFLAWLFIICVLNFPRVCYFRFLNPGVTCIRALSQGGHVSV